MEPSHLHPDDPEQPSSKLTPSQLRSWHDDGFLIIPDAVAHESVQRLLFETRQLLSSFTLEEHPMTRFTTGQDSSHIGDEYFLTSGDKVRFFFEEDAFLTNGELCKPKEHAINKIGHYLHELSPPFREATFTTLNKEVAAGLGFQDPRVLQSMVICKQPEIGGAVPAHQDSTFLYTDPPSAVGFWIALEDATAANGCLSFAKGSHVRAPVMKRFVRQPSGGTTFEDVHGQHWPRALEPQEENREEIYDLHEVKAGTLVLIHGNLLHKSERNMSEKSRFIYTFHIIEGDNEHNYDDKNWLQPSGPGFSKLNGG